MSVDEAKEQIQNIKNAIQLRHDKSKLTDFYLLLDQVNDRIHMYKSIFFEKKPRFLIDQRAEVERRKNKYMSNLKTSNNEADMKAFNVDEDYKRFVLAQKRKRDAFYENLSTPKH